MTRSVLIEARRLVVKIGSSTLTDDQGRIDLAGMAMLAVQIAALRRQRREVLLVSSGAIATGRGLLPAQLPAGAGIARKQAAAAIGQSALMGHWRAMLGHHGLLVGQVLLTHEDLARRHRYLNARNTLLELLALGAVPIINENDSVVVEEIKVGDNDTLSALVTNLAGADALILLSDVAGLYSKNPRTEGDAALIGEVRALDVLTPEGLDARGSARGTGGMKSKLQAARLAAQYGVPAVIAHGREPDVLVRLCAGEALGTWFPPHEEGLSSWKAWLLHTLRPQASIFVDAGAVKALVERGSSLLPSGVRRVEGAFERGDAVFVRDEAGREIARGLIGYADHELARIQGRKSADIAAILGYHYRDEVIHRDDLALARDSRSFDVSCRRESGPGPGSETEKP